MTRLSPVLKKYFNKHLTLNTTETNYTHVRVPLSGLSNLGNMKNGRASRVVSVQRRLKIRFARPTWFAVSLRVTNETQNQKEKR
jgi:hypothetical protein